MGDIIYTESIPVAPSLTLKARNRRPGGRSFLAFRRRIVEQLATADIAKELGISQRRVRAMVARVVKWSREFEGAGDVLAMKVQHTAMLYDLYRDARTQWKRSCEDATDHTITSISGLTTKDGAPLPEKKTTRVSRRGQSGNPAMMKTLNELLGSIRGIWGADAPKQLETDDHREIIIKVIQDSEWYGGGHLIGAAATPSVEAPHGD